MIFSSVIDNFDIALINESKNFGVNFWRHQIQILIQTNWKNYLKLKKCSKYTTPLWALQ